MRVYVNETFGVKNTPLFYDWPTEVRGEYDKFMNIMLHREQKHYNFTLNLVGVRPRTYFFAPCITYSEIQKHACTAVCDACLSTPRCSASSQKPMHCCDCVRHFYNDRCLTIRRKLGLASHNKEHHTSGKLKRSVCTIYRVCRTCSKLVNWNKRKHECGTSYCKTCRSRHSSNDLCMMRPVTVNMKQRCYPEN